MTPKRFALGLVAIISGLARLYLATTDIHYADRNCGTAVFATDPTKMAVESGNLETDEFSEESLISNCDHRVLGRRLLTILPAALCAGSIIVGQKLRDRPERIRGSIFGAGPQPN